MIIFEGRTIIRLDVETVNGLTQVRVSPDTRRLPEKSVHEGTRNGTKGARTFVGFLREVWCGFVDKSFPASCVELTLF